jgi:hypothetical protein
MKTLGARARAYALVIGIVGGLAFPTVSLAGQTTTQPSHYVKVVVTISDRGIAMGVFTTVETGQYIELASNSAARGLIGEFTIRNQGKKPHNFALLGKKTQSIRPGGVASFALAFLARGSFPYQSTLDKGKRGFVGDFNVT